MHDLISFQSMISEFREDLSSSGHLDVTHKYCANKKVTLYYALQKQQEAANLTLRKT